MWKSINGMGVENFYGFLKATEWKCLHGMGVENREGESKLALKVRG